MKQRYKSRLEPVLLLPVVLFLFILEIFLVIQSFWIGAGIVLIGALFLAYVCRFTCYKVLDGRVVIKIGVLYRKEVYISTIKKLRVARDVSVAPALGFDRVEICFNRYGRILVSPDEQAEFISELIKMNPKIRVNYEGSRSKKLKIIPDLF